MKASLMALALAAFVATCCPPALALDPSLDVSQYAHTSWKIREGFATGIGAQTADGYLWLATESGLLRFDGVRTVPWQPPPGEHLPSSDIRSVVAARDGTLWIGTAHGLVSWKYGKLSHYPELDGRDVYSMLEDREGTIWAGGAVWESDSPGKLCAINSGGVHCYGSDGSLGYYITAMFEDSRGNLWLGAGNGLWRWRPGPPQHYVLPELKQIALPGLSFARNAFAEGEDGRLLIVGHREVWQFVNGKLKPYPMPSALPQLNEGALLRDRDGGLWIGGLDIGILHVHQGRIDVFAEADGLTSNSVKSFFEDREGSIWVSTSGGLDRFREYTVPTISVKQGLSSPFVGCVLAAKDGSVWLGTSDGLNRRKNGQITVYRRPRTAAETRQSTDTTVEGQTQESPDGIQATKQRGGTAHEIISSELPDNYVTSLFQGTDGRVWVATLRGLAYFENNGFVRLKRVHLPPFSQLAGDSSGNLWGTNGERGVFRLREGRVVEHFPWARLGIGGSRSNPLVTDPVHGGLWLASWGGGVVYFRDGQVRASYSPANGLGAGRVNALQLDPDGTLWAATDGGLSHIKDGRVATLTTKNGLPCDTFHDLIEDDSHSFWLYTACGLVRVARTELEAWAADSKRRIEATVFGTSDGVMSHAGVFNFGPRVAKTADGRLWFLPLDGVSVVDPHHLPFDKVPPPVHVEQIVADRKTYWQNSAATVASHLRLPARVRDVSIDYTALSFVALDKIRFRYKLEGQDRDWREVVNDRRVQYSNLAPGYYRFRVTACNNSGVWNEAGTFLDFSIAPAYYQTNWFRALCLAAFLAIIWAAYRYRVRQMALQFNMRAEERVSERTRIARELHDTLLQNFQALLLRFQSVLKVLPEHELEARRRLERALDQATKAIMEGRDAVQGLRSVIETNDLVRCITLMGERLSADRTDASSPAIDIEVVGATRNLKPIVHDEVYRIAGEALRNAFRHAQAQKISVEIRYEEQQFRLRVRDDGKGMDDQIIPWKTPAGHFGLHGMRERAELVGGRLDIWSKLDSGTEIQLSIPATIAYA